MVEVMGRRSPIQPRGRPGCRGTPSCLCSPESQGPVDPGPTGSSHDGPLLAVGTEPGWGLVWWVCRPSLVCSACGRKPPSYVVVCLQPPLRRLQARPTVPRGPWTAEWYEPRATAAHPLVTGGRRLGSCSQSLRRRLRRIGNSWALVQDGGPPGLIGLGPRTGAGAMARVKARLIAPGPLSGKLGRMERAHRGPRPRRE